MTSLERLSTTLAIVICPVPLIPLIQFDSALGHKNILTINGFAISLSSGSGAVNIAIMSVAIANFHASFLYIMKFYFVQ
jgi:hypothetical protein